MHNPPQLDFAHLHQTQRPTRTLSRPHRQAKSAAAHTRSFNTNRTAVASQAATSRRSPPRRTRRARLAVAAFLHHCCFVLLLCTTCWGCCSCCRLLGCWPVWCVHVVHSSNDKCLRAKQQQGASRQSVWWVRMRKKASQARQQTHPGASTQEHRVKLQNICSSEQLRNSTHATVLLAGGLARPHQLQVRSPAPHTSTPGPPPHTLPQPHTQSGAHQEQQEADSQADDARPQHGRGADAQRL